MPTENYEDRNRREFMEICPVGGYFSLTSQYDRPCFGTLVVFGLIMLKENSDLLSEECTNWMLDLLPQ
jgi:hypothetical protein